MGMIKKISTKTVLGNVKAIVQDLKEGEKTRAMMVVGVAKGVRTGESTYGPWVSFKGQFKATNLLNGEVSVSGECFLPDIASNMIEAQLADADSVEFGFDIVIKYDDDARDKYVYEIEPLFEPQENDPLLLLEAKIKNNS